jgi:hypothetical protein
MGDLRIASHCSTVTIKSQPFPNPRCDIAEHEATMLGTTITLSVNSVNKVLSRVSDPEPYSSTYFLEDGVDDYTLTFKHTVPRSRGASKESHLVRLDVNTYDATSGALLRKHSTWIVDETGIGKQDSTTAGYHASALATWFNTNKALVLARES